MWRGVLHKVRVGSLEPTHTRARRDACIHMYAHHSTHTSPRTYTHTHKSTYVHTHTRPRTHIHTSPRTHAHTHTSPRTHTRTSPRTHTRPHNILRATVMSEAKKTWSYRLTGLDSQTSKKDLWVNGGVTRPVDRGRSAFLCVVLLKQQDSVYLSGRSPKMN